MTTMPQRTPPHHPHDTLIDQKKIRQFTTLLKTANLSTIDKTTIMFILEYLQGKHNPKIASKSFLFYGDTGIGKTYLAEQLLQTLHIPILYMSCTDFSFPQATRIQEFKDLLRKAKQNTRQILFFDDLGYLLLRGRLYPNPDDITAFMELLDLAKTKPDTLLIATMNTIKTLDEQMTDRIEVKIHFEIPTNQNKLQYLTTCFADQLTRPMRTYVSNNSIGYNYRDLPEVIKLAYRLGNNTITLPTLKKALRTYRPTQLYGYTVENAVEQNLNDIIGKEHPTTMLRRCILLYKNDVLCNKLHLHRQNLLLFHGPPGTGKSFMARALAGEIGYPLINIEGKNLIGAAAMRTIGMITGIAKRYRHCIIFIDEAEKLFGNTRMSADNPILGELHRCIDGVDGQEIQSILIFAVNDLSRFGHTLLDRFVLIEFALPTFEDRMTFFKDKITQIHHHIHLKTTSRELALLTEHMSYRDLDRFWNDLIFSHIEDTTRQSQHHADQITKQLRKTDQNEIMFA